MSRGDSAKPHEAESMTFHEKSAWLSLCAILVVSAIYFLHVPMRLAPPHDVSMPRAFFYCLLAFVAIEVVGHLVIALRSPGEARAPRDERERLIDLKSIRLAAYVYVVGSFVAVSTLHHGADAIAIGNGVLLAFVVAQLVNYGARIVYHRRGL